MDSIKVSDCMTHQFVSFSPTMTVVEAAMALVKNELLGGPVVDEQGYLKGWVSEQDCISVVSQVMYYEDRVAMVEDVMTQDVTTVGPALNAMDIAENMKSHKRKVYPVVDQESKVIGVISRRHILKEMCERISHPDH